MQMSKSTDLVKKNKIQDSYDPFFDEVCVVYISTVFPVLEALGLGIGSRADKYDASHKHFLD